MNMSVDHPGVPATRVMSRALVAAVIAAVMGSAASANVHSTSAGRAIYMRGCVACHGADGSGAMPGIPDLSAAGGALSKPDDQLLASIIGGVESDGAPISMPPRGGDETLTEKEAALVLAFIRETFTR